jgi:hypothetical protein
MKSIKLLTILVCAAGLIAGATRAIAAEEGKKKPCCEAKVEAEKKCAHECCTKAAAEGKICTKCHKEDKKDDKKS